MALEVQPAGLADLDAAKQVYGPELGDFSSPIARACWPLTSDSDLEQHRQRAAWSIEQQKMTFTHDPTVRMIKCVDTTLPPDDPRCVVALARWNFYDGKFFDAGDKALFGDGDRNDPSLWPLQLDKEMFLACLDGISVERRKWLREGRFWVLTTVVTRDPCRKRGAGSLLVRWGLEQARKDGIPSLLESTAPNKKWYESFGYREIGTIETVVKDMKLITSRMRADP